MKNLARLVTLMKYCSDNLDQDGLETLYDVVNNKTAFGNPDHNVAEASEVALHVLHTLYHIDGAGNVIYGRPKLDMEELMADLCNFLERVSYYRDSEWGEAI